MFFFSVSNKSSRFRCLINNLRLVAYSLMHSVVQCLHFQTDDCEERKKIFKKFCYFRSHLRPESISAPTRFTHVAVSKYSFLLPHRKLFSYFEWILLLRFLNWLKEKVGELKDESHMKSGCFFFYSDTCG